MNLCKTRHILETNKCHPTYVVPVLMKPTGFSYFLACLFASFVLTGDIDANAARPRLYPEPSEIRVLLSSSDGDKGYESIADKHFHENMFEAYVRVSRALTPREFADLGWGKQYQGSTKDYRAER